MLVLTARDRVDHGVRSFDIGAADDLVKRFQWPELLARVLLKRNQAVPADPVARRGPRDLSDPPSCYPQRPPYRCVRQGVRVVFAASAEAGQVLSRARIGDPSEGRLIHTVRGVGVYFSQAAMLRHSCAQRRQATAHCRQCSMCWCRSHSCAHNSQICAQKAQKTLALSLARLMADAATSQAWAQSMSSAMQRAIILTSCSCRQDAAQWLQLSAQS